MRIQILSDALISAQACTYAEYRLFETLSHTVDTARVSSARLELRRTRQKRHSGSVSCTVLLEIDHGDVLRIRAIGGHPYAAINHAVARIPPAFQIDARHSD
jgi:hypothetical protein